MEIIYDIEVYPNFFCCTYIMNEMMYSATLKNLKDLPWKNKEVKWIGFNNRKYDHPIILEALKGASKYELFQMSKRIIYSDENPYICWDKNIIDLLEICPKMSKCSLKEMGHRLGYKVLQNLPYDFNKKLDVYQMKELVKYSFHDVVITSLLWEKLKPEYQARQGLKSYFNAQTEFGGTPRVVEKCMLSILSNPILQPTNKNKLFKMDNLILSPYSQALYDEAFDYPFEKYKEEKNDPDFIKNTHVINGLEVKIGRGGLHSINNGVYKNVYEYDVTSYYPSIILNCELGSVEFRAHYKRIYDERLRLKEAGSPLATSLKLVLNSMYGKLIDQYANPLIHAPEIGLSICLLGQFYLIDLIEKLPKGLILWANTDGIITSKPIDKDILNEWSSRTKFNLECKIYDTYLIKDVNNFYGLQGNAQEKRKGCFLKPRWTHNTRASIIQEAVIKYFVRGIPIANTITETHPIYDYCFFVKAKRGAKLLLDDLPLDDPKVRYYCSTIGCSLKRVTDKSAASIRIDSPLTLCMNLVKTNPINYDWYIKEAQKLIDKITEDKSCNLKTKSKKRSSSG